MSGSAVESSRELASLGLDTCMRTDVEIAVTSFSKADRRNAKQRFWLARRRKNASSHCQPVQTWQSFGAHFLA
jgi:hypothetical protein